MKGTAFWTSLVALSALPAAAMAQAVSTTSTIPLPRATPAPSADMGLLSLVMMGAAVGVVLLLRKRKA
jgi:hypothetical protein